MSSFGSKHWPTEIGYNKAEKMLEIAFDSGESFRIPAELLRVESPSAEVQGHSPDQRQLVAGKQGVGIIEIEQVGNYAIKIVFDDTHDTGLYTWDLLHEMGSNQETIWTDYLSRLEEAGLSRDPKSVPPPAKSGGCGSGKAAGSCGCS